MKKHRYVLDWTSMRDEVIRSYGEGTSTRRLGKRLGVSHATINKRLSLWGVSRIGRRRSMGASSKVEMFAGRVIGKMTIIGRHPLLYPARWICLCSCGRQVNFTEKQLKKKRSCGCDGRKR